MTKQGISRTSDHSRGRFRSNIAILLAMSLVSMSFLTGCGSSGDKTGKTSSMEIGPKEKAPFTFDYKTDEKTVKFFTENDSIVTLMSSTPFYAGNQPLPSQKTSEFDKARAKKVEEIIEDADKLVVASDKIKPKLEKIRLNFLSYMTVTLKQEPKLEDTTKEVFSQISIAMSKEQIIESEIKSFKKVNPKGAYAESFIDYMTVSKSVELGNTYLQDISDIGVSAALMLEALKDSKDPKILEANKKLDKDMKMIDGLKSNQMAIMGAMNKVDYGFKQLATGDYYMAVAANKFMGSKMKDLELKAKTLKPSDNFTAEDIKFAQQYLEFFKSTQRTFDEYLKTVDKKTLVPVKKADAQTSGLLSVPAAYADAAGSGYADAVVSLATPATPPASTMTDYFKKGWNGIKTVAHGAQTTIGVGIDVLGTAVTNITRAGYGKYYGESNDSIWKDMKKNTQVITDNFNNNKSGSSTYETAGEYLEGVEKGAGEAVGGVIEKGIGKGWTSWGANGIIKTTVGMFTGLGKGLYKLGNRNSGTVQIVEGALDVGLSFIGGSKVIIKGSQVPGLLKGLADSGKLLGKDGVQFVKTMLNNVDKKKLTKQMGELLTKSKLTQAEVEALIKASIEYEAKEAVNAGLKVFRADLVKQLEEIIKKGGTNALKASSEGIKQSLDDLLKASFQKNLSGFKSAMLKVMGESGTDYIDNLVGSWLDDYLKSVIKDVIESAPSNEEVSGTWTGSYTITEILMDPAEAKAQGCDYAQLQKLKGRTSSLSLGLSVGVNGAGTTDMKTGDDKKSAKAPAKYSGGHVVVDRAQDGMVLHLEGDAKRTDSGYVIDGPVTASIKGVKLFKGTWHVTKSR